MGLNFKNKIIMFTQKEVKYLSKVFIIIFTQNVHFDISAA